jgi:transposase-like protein
MKRTHEAAFKAKVAIEAIKEEETLAVLSGKYSVHSNCITNWKKDALESIQEGFTRTSRRKKDEEEITRDDLLKEIGILKMENEFLKKKYRQINGMPEIR